MNSPYHDKANFNNQGGTVALVTQDSIASVLAHVEGSRPEFQLEITVEIRLSAL